MSARRSLSEEKGTKTRFTVKEYRIIVGWLEDPANRIKIFGTDDSTKVGDSNRTTKIGGFRVLAKFMNAQSTSPKLQLTGRQRQQRFDTYMRKYRGAKDLINPNKNSGYGLTKEEVARGMTMEDKLNETCPCFRRMDALFGDKANVRPAHTLAMGTVPSPPSPETRCEDEQETMHDDEEMQDDDGQDSCRTNDGDQSEDETHSQEVLDAAVVTEEISALELPTLSEEQQQRVSHDDEHAALYGAAAVTARLAAAEAAFDSEGEAPTVIAIEDTPPTSPLPDLNFLDDLSDSSDEDLSAESIVLAQAQDLGPQATAEVAPPKPNALRTAKTRAFKPPSRTDTAVDAVAQNVSSESDKAAAKATSAPQALEQKKRKDPSNDDDEPKPRAKSAKTTSRKTTTKTTTKTATTTASASTNASEGGGKKKNPKPPRPTTHEGRLSITQSYARSAEERVSLAKEKFEAERLDWKIKFQLERDLKREEIAERREARHEEREFKQAQARQQLILELVRHNKTAEEIAAYLQLYQ